MLVILRLLFLTHLIKHGYLSNKNKFSSSHLYFNYASCKLGKSKSLAFPLTGSQASMCFLNYSYWCWGMNHVLSHVQYRFFETFIDNYSRFTWVFFHRFKANMFSTFQTFVTYMETQISTCIKILHSNSSVEYISRDFKSFLQKKGPFSHHSCHCIPKNRYLLDVIHTLLLEFSVRTRS